MRSARVGSLGAEGAGGDVTTQPHSTLAVDSWLAAHRRDVLITAAAMVGGIPANKTYPVDFLEQNLLIQTHLQPPSTGAYQA